MTQYTREELTAWMRKPIDGRQARADAAADRRIRAIAARPARASRAKWRPQPECPPGWVPFHDGTYFTDGVSYRNRDGRTLGLRTSITGQQHARLYCKGSYDAATGQKQYRRYDLAEVFRNAKNLDTGVSEARRE